MSCLIGSANVKVFGKVIHALVRISDDLYIEALPSGLVFHTVNTSKSAYACFTFKPDFFLSYKDDATENRRVLLKSCLMAFRSLPNLEKNVDKCLFDLTSAADYLLLKFFCKHGMVKVYQLYFIDNERVKGKFPTSGVLCTLSASSRLLLDGIQNFSTSVEEMTLTVYSNKVLLRNYVDDEPDPNKVVHTELTLESEEFDTYEVEQETKLTFCLKELKAILNFCEGFNVPVSIKCQAAGRPVTFAITGLRGLEVHFVLATLADRETQPISQSGSVLSITRNVEVKKRISRKTSDKYDKITRHPSSSGIPQGDSFSNSMPSSPPVANNKFAVDLSDEEDSTSILDPRMEDEDADLDHIPSTPPHKKFRTMFLGLSQATCTSMAPDPDEVLVPDSDEENI